MSVVPAIQEAEARDSLEPEFEASLAVWRDPVS